MPEYPDEYHDYTTYITTYHACTEHPEFPNLTHHPEYVPENSENVPDYPKYPENSFEQPE